MLSHEVVHIVRSPGALTEGWLDLVVRGQERYSATLVALAAPASPYHWSSTIDVEVPGSPLRARLARLARRPIAPRKLSLDLVRKWGLEPDVFHGHFGPTAFDWVGVARAAEVPLVASFYGGDASMHTFKRGRWARQYRQLFRACERVLVEGPALAARVEHLGCSGDKIRVVRLPFDPGVVVSRPIDAKRGDIVMGGRFVEKKGFDVGLRAFALVAAGLGRRLLLIGGGPEERSLRRLASSLRVDHLVDFVGPLELHAFAEKISASAVTMFPSRTARNGDGEGGAPLTLTLAQALKVPVVVSDHDDLPFAASSVWPVFREGDVDGAAAALEYVLKLSPDDRASMADEASAFVAATSSTEVVTRARESVYDEVLR